MDMGRLMVVGIDDEGESLLAVNRWHGSMLTDPDGIFKPSDPGDLGTAYPAVPFTPLGP